MHVHLSILQNMIKQGLVFSFYKKKCSSKIATIQMIRERWLLIKADNL